MPRKIIPLDPELPYHIAARCINRDWFDLPLEKVWLIMENYLFFIHHAFEVEILSFVLMQNHFHLLARFPANNMSEALRYFMRETSRQITKSGKRINQTYGSRYFRTQICSHHYFLHAYKYVYRNPVEANFSCRPEEYPYSTLPGLLGLKRASIPVAEDLTLFSDIEGTLNWLSASPSEENREILKRSLKRPKFQLALNRRDWGPNPLETERY